MNERDIFLSAVEITDPAERVAYLEHACDGNTELRVQVEELLRTHVETSQFLETPAVAVDSEMEPTIMVESSGADTDEDSVDERASGEAEFRKYLQPATRTRWLGRLGHYEIEEILGRGAFGIVAKAFDEKLHRVVAIKLMSPELASTSPPRKRFLREARTAAAVTHENIVAIHAVEEEPIPYLVMEYIPGQTLQQRMDGHGPLEVPDILRIGQQVASGMAAAHAANLIHRDIKPSNILLSEGISERAKISDFGLARAVDDASMTQSGMIAGTPMYMAPEQARGETLDHRADLFSLGSVLYQMVSGRPPFRAANTIAVLKRVCEDTPRPLDDVIPETPDWLQTIIFRLLEKQRDDRYQTAQEVAELLARCQNELQHDGKVTCVEARPSKINAVQKTPTSKPPHSLKKTIGGMICGLVAGLIAVAVYTNLPGPKAWPRGAWDAADHNLNGVLTREEMELFATQEPHRNGPRLLWHFDNADTNHDGTADHAEIEAYGYATGSMDPDDHLPPPRASIPDQNIAIAPVPAKTDAASAEVDREAAKWVLSVGGTIGIDGQPTTLTGQDELPSEPFQLIAVTLNGNQQATDENLKIFTECARLQSVGLTKTPVTDAGLQCFRRCAELSRLELHYTQVTDQGLAELRHWSKLQSLGLNACLQITDAGLRHLSNTPQLTTLAVAGCPITDELATTLSELSLLSSLNLSFTGMTAHGLRKLATLPLRDLYLSGSPLTDQDLAVLEQWPQLSLLRFDGTSITDAGLEHVGRLRRLRSLRLDSTAITDQGLQQLKALRALTGLNLDQTQTTVAGLLSLHELANLQTLRLEGTKMEEADLATLSQRYPQCRIHWDGGVFGPAPVDDEPHRLAATAVLPYMSLLKIHVAGEAQPRDLWPAQGVVLPDEPFELEYIQFGKPCDVATARDIITLLKPLRSLDGINAPGEQLFPLDSSMLRELLESPVGTALTSLDDAAVPLTSENVELLKQFPNLTSASFRVDGADDALFAEIGQLNLPYALSLHGFHARKQPGAQALRLLETSAAEQIKITYADALTRSAAIALAKNPHVKLLWLWGTTVSSDLLPILLKSANCTSLILTRSGMTDAALVHLAQGTRLQYLDLASNTLTEAAVRRLAKALPQSKIVWDGGVIEPSIAGTPAQDPKMISSTGWHGWPADAPAPAIAPFDADQAKAHQESWAKYLGVPVEYENSIGMKFRLIPPGEFMMGSTPEEIQAALKVAGEDEQWRDSIKSEGPLHKVVLTQPVYVGATEVTQRNYELVMGTNPAHFSATGDGREFVDGMETANFPVETVSWNDAAEFCARISQRENLKPFYLRSGFTVTVLDGTGYRMPTEAEWEYSCRAGTVTRYWHGDEYNTQEPADWNMLNSDLRTHRVGELKANPFGLSDMYGNVFEWAQDPWVSAGYATSPNRVDVDPSNADSFADSRVVRGGRYYDNPANLRSSFRWSSPPLGRNHYTGLRVVISVEAVKQMLRETTQLPRPSPPDTRHSRPADAPPPAIAPFDADQAKTHQEAWAKYLGVLIEYTNSIGMKFRLIPLGEFLMESTPEEIEAAFKAEGEVERFPERVQSEGPRHKVILTQPVYVGVTEVTQSHYEQVMGTIYGELIPEPTRFQVTRWATDSFALESYSVNAVGSAPRVSKILAAPQDDKVFFAGEDVSDYHRLLGSVLDDPREYKLRFLPNYEIINA